MAAHCSFRLWPRMRIDATVTKTHIRAPLDGRLLQDGLRVPTWLPVQGRRPWRSRIIAAPRSGAKEAGSQREVEFRAKSHRKLPKLTDRNLGYVEVAPPMRHRIRRWWNIVRNLHDAIQEKLTK